MHLAWVSGRVSGSIAMSTEVTVTFELLSNTEVLLSFSVVGMLEFALLAEPPPFDVEEVEVVGLFISFLLRNLIREKP